MHINKLGTVAFAVVAMTLSGVPALAVEVAKSHDSNQTTVASDKVAAAETRLAETKLKVCQNREKAIDNIMKRIAERGQKHIDLFSTIATRTETFYTTKGKTLSNYDALVAAVDAKKVLAQAAVDKVKGDSVTFKCDGTDPKGAGELFKADLKLEISALKEYRTSVKNLIVGVKSVQGTTSSTENKTTSTDKTTSGGSQ